MKEQRRLQRKEKGDRERESERDSRIGMIDELIKKENNHVHVGVV